MCRDCGARTGFPQVPRCRRAVCPAVEGLRRVVHASHRSCCMWTADDMPIVFCVACGAYGTARPKALGRECAGRVLCASRHKLLLAGKHPITKVVCGTPVRLPLCAAQACPQGNDHLALRGPPPEALEGPARAEALPGVGPEGVARLAELASWDEVSEDAPMMGWEGLDESLD